MQSGLIADRYRITDRVSEDGVGVSYQAVDEQNNQAVVIRVLHEKFARQSLENVLRFKRDIAKLSKNRHPNIMPIYDTGGNGAAYVVQGDIEGGSALCSRIGKFNDLDTVTDIVLQISSGLESAHRQDVLHRMINPWDIIVVEKDNGVTAKLTGFGTGLLIDLAGVKESEEIVRIFGYMSPETTGILRKPVDNRSDLYSLGIVFYQLATGRLPYDGKDIATLVHQHIAQKPAPPTEINPSVPPVMERIILRLMAKDPLDRYQTVSGLMADLREYMRQRAAGKEVPEFEIARRDRAAHLTFAARLVGRDRELNTLQALISRAKQGQGGLALVYGPPGVGKSRLIDELRGYIHSNGGVFVGGKCYQNESTTPFDVFSEALDAYVRKLKRKGEEEQNAAIARIKEAVGQLGREVLKIAPTMVDLIGPQPDLEALETEKERLRFMLTVSGFLLSLGSRQNPFVIFLDDIQWADDGNIELLSKVAEGVSRRPIVVIAGYRDTDLPEGSAWSGTMKMMKEKEIPVADIRVDPFSPAGASRVISEILMEDEAAVLPLARILHERTEGNAFFLLELLRSLVDQGLIYFQDDHYRYEMKKLGAAALPKNVIDVVVKRIDQISEEKQKILAYSAIMGNEIEFERISDLTGIPREKVMDAIEEGVRNQLLTRDITGRENVVFMHDRIREALYKLISEEEKVSLHAQIAKFLEEQNKDNPEPVLFELAYHFSQAYVAQAEIQKKTLSYSLQAARKAQAAYAYDQAIRLYSVVTKILEDQDKTTVPEYIDAMENLGLVYKTAGRFDEALEALRTCERLIPRQDALRRAEVLSKAGDTLWEKGEGEQATGLLREALKSLGVRLPKNMIGVGLGLIRETVIQLFHTLFPNLFVRKEYRHDQKKAVIVRIVVRIAYFYYFTDIIKCLHLGMKFINMGERMGPCRVLSNIYAAHTVIWSGMPVAFRAWRDGNLGVKVAQDLHDRVAEGVAYAYLAVSTYSNRGAEEAYDYARRSVELLKGVGEYWDLGIGLNFRDLGGMLVGRNLNEALEDAEEAITIARSTGSLQMLGFGLYGKTYALALIGDEERIRTEGIRAAREALEVLGRAQDKPNGLLARSFLALAYVRAGMYDEAIETTEEMARLFSKHNNKAGWIHTLFPTGAQVYLDCICRKSRLTEEVKQKYLERAGYFCRRALWRGYLFPYIRSHSYQVNGTYQWLTGNRKKALETWERGITYIRKQTKDTYRLASILLEEASFLLKDNPKDKTAQEYLIEAKELFTRAGAKLDLERAEELLKSVSPETVAESRQTLTVTRHLESLLSVTKTIGSIFVLDELLEKIVEQAMKVTGAERGFLLLYDEKEKTLKQKVSQGMEKTLATLPFSYENYKLSLNMVQETEKTGEGLFAGEGSKKYPQISGDLKEYAIREAMCVPLKAKEKALGMIYLDNRMAGGMFGQEELELMKSFAVQASISIENAYLVSNMVEQERLKQEMELGRQIQLSLLPQKTPVLRGYKIEGLMNPAQEIGGDYYDFVPISGDGDGSRLGVVIADVSGKGVDAGMVMAITKSLIHSLSGQDMTTREMVLNLNKHLCNLLRRQKFVSLIYAECTEGDNEFHWSGAGHEYVLVLRNSASREVEEIMTGGVILGVFDKIDNDITEKSISLNKGDKVILYTDGVTEAKNEGDELFTRQRLVGILRQAPQLPAKELLNYVDQEIKKHIGDTPQYDDITLVVVEKE